MEQDTTAKIAEQKKLREQKTRKKRTIGWIAVCVVVVLLAVGGWLLYHYLSLKQVQETMTSYKATAIQEGEINSVISGSGTLSANHEESFTAPGDYTTVESVNYQTGDSIPAGSVVMTLSCLDVEEEIDTLEAELDDVLDELATVDQEKSSLNVTAPKSGVVKDLQASVGTVTDDVDYLCLLSTDGKMKVVIDATDAIHKYDDVVVRIGSDEVEGRIAEIDSQNDTATVILEDNSYDYGAQCTVLSQSGETVGTGTLDVNEYVKVNATTGKIALVNCQENQKCSKGKALFKLESGAQTDEYLSYKKQREDLEEQIQNLKDGLIITADWDCILTALSVEKGDKLSEGDALCSLSSTDGYQLSLSIDELDISSVQHGQKATITLDAVEGEYEGTVDNISYSGSGSYVTSYTVSIVTEPIEGAYPGMSASAEVVIESSGNSLIIPVGAVQYEGRGEEQKAYVYLAADGTTAGDTKTADAIHLDSLEKVYLTTGMSDGSYIVIQSDSLKAGDLIWQSTLTTNAVYTEDDSSSTTDFGMGGNMGGMPSGSMGGGMPSGGMPSGGMPGNMGGGSRG